MRVLVLGAGGLLGHTVVRRLSPLVDTWGTVRSPAVAPSLQEALSGATLVPATADRIEAALALAAPDAVVNCIGVTRSDDPVRLEALNARFPHDLARRCADAGARLVHVSTDAVFSGRRGGSTETDPPDPSDAYGAAKLRGEVTGPGCLTLRTSMVGWELTHSAGLLEWLAANRDGAITGWRGARFSGPTAWELAGVIAGTLEAPRPPEGLYHVAAGPITKYDLLRMVAGRLGWPVTIMPVDAPAIDRSLDGGRLEALLGWAAPGWEEMAEDLARQRPDYERWRAALAASPSTAAVRSTTDSQA